MSNHGLTRNQVNEPVCICGYRPEILDELAPVGKQWKARTIVLDHAWALNDAESESEWEAAIDSLVAPKPAPATPRRSPADPFIIRDAEYPRAGVRQTEDGRWMLCLWDGEQVLHVFDEPVFDDRQTAFDYGWLTIGACRDSGTNLNGMEAA